MVYVLVVNSPHVQVKNDVSCMRLIVHSPHVQVKYDVSCMRLIVPMVCKSKSFCGLGNKDVCALQRGTKAYVVMA